MNSWKTLPLTIIKAYVELFRISIMSHANTHKQKLHIQKCLSSLKRRICVVSWSGLWRYIAYEQTDEEISYFWLPTTLAIALYTVTAWGRIYQDLDGGSSPHTSFNTFDSFSIQQTEVLFREILYLYIYIYFFPRLRCAIDKKACVVKRDS